MKRFLFMFPVFGLFAACGNNASENPAAQLQTTKDTCFDITVKQLFIDSGKTSGHEAVVNVVISSNLPAGTPIKARAWDGVFSAGNAQHDLEQQIQLHALDTFRFPSRLLPGKVSFFLYADKMQEPLSGRIRQNYTCCNDSLKKVFSENLQCTFSTAYDVHSEQGKISYSKNY